MIDWTPFGGLKTLPGSLPVAGDSSASIEAPYVEMLAALLSASGARAVLETGTHIGLTAAALAHTFPATRIETVEHDPDMFQRAARVFARLELKNVIQHAGDSVQLCRVLPGPFDLAILDSDESVKVAEAEIIRARGIATYLAIHDTSPTHPHVQRLNGFHQAVRDWTATHHLSAVHFPFGCGFTLVHLRGTV